ncbi:hypothetical protein GCM10023165_36640 [Variovorax defluvii]|uniref:Uncharacterized protein n=1 Tax=Variovorax defluvii TaxID=913761 RepID=A0ABP8I2E4_9BURK
MKKSAIVARTMLASIVMAACMQGAPVHAQRVDPDVLVLRAILDKPEAEIERDFQNKHPSHRAPTGNESDLFGNRRTRRFRLSDLTPSRSPASASP